MSKPETDEKAWPMPTVLAEYVALAETVLAMRQAQRQYFKTRSQSDLVASKRLESAVDVRLATLGYK